MPSYTLELEIFGIYSSDIPQFEIWAEGALDSTHNALSSGSTISVTITYGGALPSSLEFRFNDALPEGGRTIEIRSVKINDKYVNTGNYLSSDSLTNGGAAGVVDVADSDFIFEPSVDMSEFSGATSLTAGNDFYYNHLNTALVIDALGGNDSIIVGAGDDNINGGAGNDYITVGAGADYVFGDTGNDTIWAGDGNDTVFAGDDDDRVYGGNGNDELHGGVGNDKLSGQAGDDEITGGDGDDKITGGSGTNHLYGDAGDDRIMGGSGIDTIDGGADNDILFGGGNNDIIDGGDGDDRLYGGNGDDTLNGNDGNDIIVGMNGADTIYGSNGQDSIYGGDGDDTIDGGDGDDIISASEDVLNVIATLGTGDYLFNINGTVQTLHIDFDGTDHWLLVGRGRENWEFDTDGQGTIANMTVGLGTTAAFAPVAYDDTFVDDLIKDTGNDLTDTQIRLKRAANTTGTEWQEVRWDAISQTDWTFDFDGADYDVEHRVSDSVLGTAFTDLTSRTRDTMSTPGSDSGNNYQRIWDWSWGGKGGIQGFSYGSTVAGVNNNDPNTFLWENTTENHATPYTEVYIRLDVATAALNSTLGDDTINGGAGNDTIIDDLGADTIDGGTGNDIISSGVGNDILNGGTGDDTIHGGAGDDTIDGDDDDDTIHGDDGDDTIDGGNGDDVIDGGDGDDVIDGGDGDDTIYGDQENTSGTIRNSLSNEILADSPVLYYKMNETSGTTVINYGTLGSAVDGTLSGTYTLDDTSQHLVSDGTIDFEGSSLLDVPDSTSINTAAHTVRSVELVFTADSTTGRQMLYEEGGNTNVFTMYLDGSNIYFNARDSGEYGPFTITTGITAGTTYHAAFTFDSVTNNLFTGYLNGAVVGTGVTNTDMDSHGGDIGIGNVNGSAYMHDGTSSGNYYFDGRISDVAIYNSVLSATDIQERSDIVAQTATSNTNTITDGDGLDTLYASDVQDIFLFESANATNDTDIIENFSAGHGDQLDISDLLTGFTPGTSDINDFVQLTESGGNTTIAIDSNGTTGGSTYLDIAQLNGVTGLNATLMEADGIFIL